MMAYKEQCQQAIVTWVGKAKVTYWSASGAWAGIAKEAHGCSLDEEEGAQALDWVQRHAPERVGSRAHAVRAVEEQRATVHKVQKQVLQQVRARAHAVQVAAEGLEASRRQQAMQEEESAALQEEDSSPEAALHRVQRQALQRAGSKAQTVQAVEERRANPWAMAHKVHTQILQQVSARAQEMQTAEKEGSQMELLGIYER